MKKMGIALLSGLLTFSLASTGMVPVSAAVRDSAGEDTYLLAFKQELPDDYEDLIEEAGGEVLRALPEIGGVEVEAEDEDFLDQIADHPEILAANRQLVHKLDYRNLDRRAADGQPVTDIPQPDEIDSYWEYQWDIQRVTNNGKSYELETGGSVRSNGEVRHKAVVGIIDSGIDPDHPDLRANLLGGVNFVPAGIDGSETGDPDDIVDRDGHGTHVAGAIAGNGKIKGVGPDLGIRAYRVFPEGQGAATSWIVAAILQAVEDDVDVINMSLGGFDAISRYQFQGEGNYSDIADLLLWRRAVQYAVKNGVTVVVAAGNESLNLNNPTKITDYMNDTYGYLGFEFQGASAVVPAQVPGVITVSSSVEWTDEKIAFYSNYGNRTIDIAAPGGDNGPVYDETGDLDDRDFHFRTLSTWPTYLEPYFTSNLHDYALLHGTSMAAPKVAGIAGVLIADNPDLTPEEVTSIIRKTAEDFGKRGTDQLFGDGEANAYNALRD